MGNNLIAVDEICTYHHIETWFIRSLEDSGLIETTIVQEKAYLPLDQLSRLERCIRLSHDLDINPEGLHAIAHLLEQLNQMQDELRDLKNELHYYKQLQ